MRQVQHEEVGSESWWLPRFGNKRRPSDGLVEHRKLTWKDLREIEVNQISFIIRATCDVLSTPKNLKQWSGEDPSCGLYQTPATLNHILTGFKTRLSQGRYTWRHNLVLKELAIALEGSTMPSLHQCLDPQTPPCS